MMTHHELCLDLLDRFERNADYDDNRRTANGNVGQARRERANDQREEGNNAKEQRTDEDHLSQRLGDEVSGGLARTEARDEAAVLLQIIGNFDRIKLDRSIKIRKCNNQNGVEYDIERIALREQILYDTADRTGFGRIEREYRRGQRQNGRREDDRHNAGRVDLNGQEGGLAAVHLTTNHTLCILNRDTAFGVRHIHDEHDQCQADDDHQHCSQCTGAAVLDQVEQAIRQRGTAGDNARKQDDRDTIANAVLGDVFAQPHDQRRTSGEGHDDNDSSPDASVVQQIIAAEHHVVREALDQTEDNRQITGPGCNLLSAFLTAILYHALERRDRNCQQLQDDRCVNIRGNRHGEQGRIR